MKYHVKILTKTNMDIFHSKSVNYTFINWIHRQEKETMLLEFSMDGYLTKTFHGIFKLFMKILNGAVEVTFLIQYKLSSKYTHYRKFKTWNGSRHQKK